MAYPILPIDDVTLKVPLPATILAPRTGDLTIRHYYGNSGNPLYGRAFVLLPARHAQEITTGPAPLDWPGEDLVIDVLEGEEIRVALLGGTGTEGDEPPNPGPTWENTGNNARVHETPIYRGAWTRYIEWEDLVIDGTNQHYNDARTLLYYDVPGWKIGRL